ncbi:hypothetical protein Tc00.1047053510841.30 [Trypanosoma cruzi]|uniref:Uncharacterized protein n=1 Tax=Trypanosoma cruzi (strain CL Brener) TaxID=353153 RepID=Q4CNW8_TRYCC|nr:hypothetical protein Tc00.1047053510841.30 [Trypanosoma cruzi]EAN81971.1 hypothetical protein Tc00.1047053510841.30 [Trypanosoma cruzi]|eukprot:XP_803498.1 hypothetical protein [Trypanosoma cruzi strain CL Brener]
MHVESVRRAANRTCERCGEPSLRIAEHSVCSAWMNDCTTRRRRSRRRIVDKSNGFIQMRAAVRSVFESSTMRMFFSLGIARQQTLRQSHVTAVLSTITPILGGLRVGMKEPGAVRHLHVMPPAVMPAVIMSMKWALSGTVRGGTQTDLPVIFTVRTHRTRLLMDSPMKRCWRRSD